MPSYLFDASSIIRALKRVKLTPLAGQAVQWLTVYEVLNALWKEAHLLHRLSPDEAASLASDFTVLLREMVILDPKGLETDILETAITLGLTVYDASYIVLAEKHGLTLVTEDKKLRSAASRVVKVAGFDEIA